jgi:hypothetical protein
MDSEFEDENEDDEYENEEEEDYDDEEDEDEDDEREDDLEGEVEDEDMQPAIPRGRKAPGALRRGNTNANAPTGKGNSRDRLYSLSSSLTVSGKVFLLPPLLVDSLDHPAIFRTGEYLNRRG